MQGTEDVFHGIRISDPYQWLEDDRNADVEAWVKSKASKTDDYFSSIPYRSAVLRRIEQLYDFEKVYDPREMSGVTCYFRQAGNQNQGVLYRRREGMAEELVLDPNTWSPDSTESLANYAISDDSKWLAYSRSKSGSDWQEIYVMDLTTMRILDEKLEWVKVSGISFYKDGFFYSRYSEPRQGSSEYSDVNSGHIACYHKINTAQSQDKVIYTDPSSPDQFNFCWVPEESEVLFLAVQKAGTRAYKLSIKHTDALDDAWHEIWNDTDHQLNVLGIDNDVILAETTLDAPNSRIVRIYDLWEKPRLETVVPTNEHPIAGASMACGKLFVVRMVDVKHEVSVYDYAGACCGTVALPGAGSVAGFAGRNSDAEVYYSYSSFTQPGAIYKYNVGSNTSAVWTEPKVPFDPARYEAKQVFATSKDGTKVPMYLVYKRAIELDSKAPTLLYGYGGFNVSLTPGFSATMIAWLEQGGIYAQMNLRGGGEYGEVWYEGGVKLKKQNVFDDAVACAEWLIANNYTNSERLALHGASNGGLLAAVLMTQQPELFRAVIPEVGVLDMLRYHLFTIGWSWAVDYGTVNDEKEFKALLAYSPYHNLKEGVNYPACMVMTADHDDRVVPAHSFKFFARLEELYKGNRSMLLRVEVNSGHGASNTKKKLESIADRYVFLWQEMGVTPKYDSSIPDSH